MSFFTRQTAVVEIDPENRVTVRKLTYGDSQEAMSAAMSMDVDIASGKLGMARVDPFRIKREQLYRAIVGWEGPGFDGQPVSKDAIDALPLDIVDQIQEAVERINGGLSDEEKKA